MKTLAILIVAAAVVLLGLPPVFGYVTAAQVAQGLAELRALQVADAELVDYDRGWFRSRARIAIRPGAGLPAGLVEPGAAAALAAQRPVVVVELAHGPFAVLDGVSIGTSRFVARLDPATAGVGGLEQRLGVPYLFEFRGRTSFLGKLIYDADMPPAEAVLGPDQRLTFSGAQVEGSYDGGRLVAEAASDALAFVTAGGTFSFDGLALELDQHLGERTGDGRIAIERSVLVDAFGTQPLFAIANLHLEGQSATGASAGLRDTRVALTADTLDVAEWPISAAALTLNLRNLDLEAIERLDALGGAAGLVTVDPTPLVERVLAAGPVLAIDPLRLQVDGEPLSATVAIATNTAALPPAGALDLLDIPLWLDVLDAHATLEVAKPLATRLAALVVARQLPQDSAVTDEQLRNLAEAQAGLALSLWMGQGMIVESGDNYRVELIVGNGAITVNGRPL